MYVCTLIKPISSDVLNVLVQEPKKFAPTSVSRIYIIITTSLLKTPLQELGKSFFCLPWKEGA